MMDDIIVKRPLRVVCRSLVTWFFLLLILYEPQCSYRTSDPSTTLSLKVMMYFHPSLTLMPQAWCAPPLSCKKLIAPLSPHYCSHSRHICHSNLIHSISTLSHRYRINTSSLPLSAELSSYSSRHLFEYDCAQKEN